MHLQPSAAARAFAALRTVTVREAVFALAAGLIAWLASGAASSCAPAATICAARAAGLCESAVVAGQERIEARISKLAARVAPAAAAGAAAGKGAGKGTGAGAGACPGHAALRAKYDAALDVPGNIEKHLPVLFGIASGFENITEIGVSSVHSSWAFARAAADAAVRGERVRYRATDIKRQPQVDELEDALEACPGVDFAFLTADDLVVETWQSNVLFLDTFVGGTAASRDSGPPRLSLTSPSERIPRSHPQLAHVQAACARARALAADGVALHAFSRPCFLCQSRRGCGLDKNGEGCAL